MIRTGPVIKLKTFLLATPVVVVGLLGLVPVAQAAPAFNAFPISYTPQTNMDLPMIDARNVTQSGSFSTSQADHDSGVSANPGDVIEFEIYYHNAAVAEDAATNVLIKASLPGGTRQSHEASATISSDQTATVSSTDAFRGGNIFININGSAQTLTFMPGSVQWFPQRSSTASSLSNSDNLLGSGVNIGTVQGCFNFSGFLTFQAQVGNQTTTTTTQNQNLSISKQVLNVTRGDNNYNQSTTANPGDRVRFRVSFNTSGTGSQTNVIVRDILPPQLSYVSGTLQLDGSAVSNQFDFFGAGLNLGTQFAGNSHTLIFDANVAQGQAFSGSSSLINTANVRSDQVFTHQDQVTVSVQQVQGVAQSSLRKTAFNVTQGVDATIRPANPGDIIAYSLYFKNTGQTAISGAVIQDDISDVEQLSQVVDQGGATSLNGSIVYAPVDVPAGVEVSRTFQVKVMAANLIPSNSDLVMDNVYGNEVRILVNRPQVRGATVPPRTGPNEWFPVVLASLATAGYAVRRKLKSRVAAIAK
jgi:uncharacterized repeat protein (TIGR01451 family)